jgi:hypothetical protein
VEEQLDAARAATALAAELAALPEGERAVLELVSYDGLTVAEAAAALGIRPGAARVRLHRARRLARRLAGDSPGQLVGPPSAGQANGTQSPGSARSRPAPAVTGAARHPQPDITRPEVPA